MAAQSILLAVGAQGLALNVPDGVALLPVAKPVQAGLPAGPLDQQALVAAALVAPRAGSPLRELARGRRRAAVIVGDLPLPAPYEIALPAVVKALVDAEIRPSRISFLVSRSNSAPILGRAAIHRYGEEIVGDHELRTFQWTGTDGDQPDPHYTAADLKLAVLPAIRGGDELLPVDLPLDATVELALGQKAKIDIAGASLYGGAPNPHAPAGSGTAAEVVLAGGGGADWETTLEEALPSLHYMEELPRTAVLAFSGGEGLGSAQFTNDLWTLLEQAEEILQGGKSLAGLMPKPKSFDAANTVAFALSSFERLVLWSRGLAEHAEGDELDERLKALPGISGVLKFCRSESDMWEALARAHAPEYSLKVIPLGWRELAVDPKSGI